MLAFFGLIRGFHSTKRGLLEVLKYIRSFGWNLIFVCREVLERSSFSKNSVEVSPRLRILLESLRGRELVGNYPSPRSIESNLQDASFVASLGQLRVSRSKRCYPRIFVQTHRPRRLLQIAEGERKQVYMYSLKILYIRNILFAITKSTDPDF